MPPKKDSWSQSRTVRNGSLEAHISLSVRGCSGEKLATFNTFFAESLTKLQDIVSNQTEQSTQEEKPDQEGPPQQDQNFTEEGEVNREGREHDQTVFKHKFAKKMQGSQDPPPQPKAGPRRRGPALMKRKCDVEDCSRSYSRALLTDAEKVFPRSNSDGTWVQLCRLHYEKVRRRR